MVHREGCVVVPSSAGACSDPNDKHGTSCGGMNYNELERESSSATFAVGYSPSPVPGEGGNPESSDGSSDSDDMNNNRTSSVVCQSSGRQSPLVDDNNNNQNTNNSNQQPSNIREEISPETRPEVKPAARQSAFAHRRNPVSGNNGQQDAPNMAAATVDSGEAAQSEDDDNKKKPASPLHIEEELDPPNFYQQEMEFEVTLLSQRNRRVLLSRLDEVAPRGRLSLVNLCRRGIGVNEATIIKEAIIANPQLYVLKLSYNNLGDEGAAIIASAILHNGTHHQVSVLDLGFNGIGDMGCGAIAVHCLAGNPNLQTLYLSGNEIGEKGALSIAGAILHGTGLRSLHLAVNEIGPTGMKAVAGAVAKNEARLTEAMTTGAIDILSVRRMEELYLANTSITSDGFLAIPGMLLTNMSLQTLSVSNNSLGDQDLLMLSQALTQNKLVPLRNIEFSFNEITCQGVECLMNAIWGSKTLRKIKLDNNKIKDRGAQLCAVVLTAIELDTLDLSFNKITTTGIKSLMKNLSENTSLRHLGLSGIPIDQNASKAVSYALAYNTALEALYLDNCSTGYASQRHIVAGAVSNRKSSLRVLTGFNLSRIAMTLGMPRMPESWSNDQVLGFFRLMWSQWLLKARQGNQTGNDGVRGPAPPAAVAAAAKIAFSSIGNQADELFLTETHQKPLSERAPVEPAGSALLERSESGTMTIPLFSVSSEIDINDFVDGESKAAALANKNPAPILTTVRSPFENPERRNKNLQWLRLHFRSLSDIGRLPFHNADLWQLHQYYFSPPVFQPEDGHQSPELGNVIHGDREAGNLANAVTTNAPPPTPMLSVRPSSALRGAVSFQALSDAILSSGALTQTQNNKRSSSSTVEDIDEGPATKKAKSLKPRIAYYPRIMAKVQSLGTKPMDQTLSLLRQLKYTESVLFSGKNPYEDFHESGSDGPSHADVDMILLDLL